MRHSGLSLQLIALTIAMFGFGFALVPIYDVFCDLTGFGGRTASAAGHRGNALRIAEILDSDRYAVKGTLVSSCQNLGVGESGAVHGLIGHHSYITVETSIHLFNAVEKQLRQLG